MVEFQRYITEESHVLRTLHCQELQAYKQSQEHVPHSLSALMKQTLNLKSTLQCSRGLLAH